MYSCKTKYKWKCWAHPHSINNEASFAGLIGKLCFWEAPISIYFWKIEGRIFLKHRCNAKAIFVVCGKTSAPELLKRDGIQIISYLHHVCILSMHSLSADYSLSFGVQKDGGRQKGSLAWIRDAARIAWKAVGLSSASLYLLLFSSLFHFKYTAIRRQR